jgi:hypothetical protein
LTRRPGRLNIRQNLSVADHPVPRRLLVTILATASIVLAGLGIGPMPRTAAEEVASAVRLCDEAWARSDVTTLDRLLAERYVHADGFGRVQRRADWLADAGRPRNVAITSEDLAVRVHGRFAIVTGADVITTPERAETQRFTQVWVRQGASWLRAASRALPLSGVAQLGSVAAR